MHTRLADSYRFPYMKKSGQPQVVYRDLPLRHSSPSHSSDQSRICAHDGIIGLWFRDFTRILCGYVLGLVGRTTSPTFTDGVDMIFYVIVMAHLLA